MKKLITLSVASVALLCGGCTSLPAVVRELKGDPALVKINIRTVYGTVEFIRNGANTNFVSVTPEGGITNGVKE